MRRIQIKNLALLLFFLIPMFIMAQTITGTVKNEKGELLPYINVTESGATNKATTNADGTFSIRVSIIPTKLVFNAIGYSSTTVFIKNTDALSVTIDEDELNYNQNLSFTNTTAANSATPVTYISGANLIATGKLTIEQMLTYGSASYNTTNQTHADASTHFDLVDLHGLGSSRALVLVNGKRKNLSAIAHVNNTYGRGEVGTDLKSIPVAAIDHIEIIRDGASAQYGSDAMAGVINIVLKKDTNATIANINSGITTNGDGFEISADINGTFKNEKQAYVNYTFSLQHQDYTDRAGEPKAENYFTGLTDASDASWINSNPELGMTVGQPKMNTANVYFNGALPFKNGKGELYASVGGEVRKGESFAMARTPYMNADPINLYSNNVYEPTFETSIIDNMDVFGVKYKTGEFNIDANVVFGINKAEYRVANSTNPDISVTHVDYDPLDPTTPQPTGPTDFEAGSYSANNIIGNATINRKFDKANVTFGAEYKIENFKISQGEFDSWYATGAQSFYGIDSTKKLNEDRNNVAAFAAVDLDLTTDFMFGAAVRYDNYSDVGDNLSYKANASYKFGDKGAVKASYGTSFRAPALQQIYANNKQNRYYGSSVILDASDRALLNIADLEAETSTNMTVGFFIKPIKNLAISLDYYKIDIDDRVVLSSNIVDNSTNVLTDNNVDSFSFFTNAVNTETQGIDLTFSYDNIRFPKGVLGFDLSANWNDTEIVGDVNTPTSLSTHTILNRTDRSRIETSRPSIKGMLGINYQQEKFNASLNNTYFGEVTWQHATDATKDQAFAGKVVTDVVLGYNLYEWMKINLIINNALDVYPDEIDNKGDASTDLGNRFKYAYQLNQFDILGTQIRGGVTFQF